MSYECFHKSHGTVSLLGEWAISYVTTHASECLRVTSLKFAGHELLRELSSTMWVFTELANESKSEQGPRGCADECQGTLSRDFFSKILDLCFPPAQVELATRQGLGFQSTNVSYGISCCFKMLLEQSESFAWVVLFASNATSDQSSTEERVPQRI